MLQVQAAAAQIDIEQRLVQAHHLAFFHMHGGDDAAFQMLYGLHAVRGDDLAAGDHHVLHRVEQAEQNQQADG